MSSLDRNQMPKMYPSPNNPNATGMSVFNQVHNDPLITSNSGADVLSHLSNNPTINDCANTVSIKPQAAVADSLKLYPKGYERASPTDITDEELIAIIEMTKISASQYEADILEEMLKSCTQSDNVASVFRDALKRWCLGIEDSVDRNTLDEAMGKCCALASEERD